MARERGAADIAERAALRFMGCDQVESSEKEFKERWSELERRLSYVLYHVGKIRVIFRSGKLRQCLKQLHLDALTTSPRLGVWSLLNPSETLVKALVVKYHPTIKYPDQALHVIFYTRSFRSFQHMNSSKFICSHSKA